MTHGTEDLDRYLRILAGDDPAGRLIEIRSTIPDGMRQTFTPATRPELAAKTITRLAARTDVYVGVLLRRRRGGGRDACERSHLAFIEIDQPDGARAPRPVPLPADHGHLHPAVRPDMPTPTGSCTSPSASTNSKAPTGAWRSGSAATSPASTPPASSGPPPRGIGNGHHPAASSCSSSSRAGGTRSTSSPPASASPTSNPGPPPRPRGLRSASSTGGCLRSPPRPTCRRSPAATPTARAKSLVPSTPYPQVDLTRPAICLLVHLRTRPRRKIRCGWCRRGCTSNG